MQTGIPPQALDIGEQGRDSLRLPPPWLYVALDPSSEALLAPWPPEEGLAASAALLVLWPPTERARAWCIAYWESSWRPWAVNRISGCAGLFAICPQWHRERLSAYGGWHMVYDPEVNSRVAHSIWVDWGGTWGAWAETAWRCR